MRRQRVCPHELPHHMFFSSCSGSYSAVYFPVYTLGHIFNTFGLAPQEWAQQVRAHPPFLVLGCLRACLLAPSPSCGAGFVGHVGGGYQGSALLGGLQPRPAWVRATALCCRPGGRLASSLGARRLKCLISPLSIHLLAELTWPRIGVVYPSCSSWVLPSSNGPFAIIVLPVYVPRPTVSLLVRQISIRHDVTLRG